VAGETVVREVIRGIGEDQVHRFLGKVMHELHGIGMVELEPPGCKVGLHVPLPSLGPDRNYGAVHYLSMVPGESPRKKGDGRLPGIGMKAFPQALERTVIGRPGKGNTAEEY
jgi:hypothetical protein